MTQAEKLAIKAYEAGKEACDDSGDAIMYAAGYAAGYAAVTAWVPVTPETMPDIERTYIFYDAGKGQNRVYETKFWLHNRASVIMSPELWNDIYYTNPPTL